MKYFEMALKAELESRIGASDYLRDSGDAVLITRGTPRWLIMKCPCGCGDEVPVNLDRRSGKAWRLYRGGITGITLYPSVWRDTGCKSHFIVWRDQILLFGGEYRRLKPLRDQIDLGHLTDAVLKTWPKEGYVFYADVAEILREIPWDVLEACRDLVDAGKLVQGMGTMEGHFRRIS